MKIFKILSSAIFCAAGLAALGASAKANIIPVDDPYFDQFPPGQSAANFFQVACGPGCFFADKPVVGWTASGTFDTPHGILSGQWQIGQATNAFNGPPIIAGTATPELIVERDINATISQVVSTTALAGVTYTLDVDLGFNLGRAPRPCLRLSHRRGPSVGGSNPIAVLRPDAGADAGQRQLVRFSDFLHRDQRGRWRSDRDPAFILDRQRHANRVVRRCAADQLIDRGGGRLGHAGACDLGDAADWLRRNGWRCCCSPLLATAKRGESTRLTATTG